MSNLNVQSDQLLVEPLTARELEILSLMADHRSNREIADVLVLSLNTVKWYARQIYGKLEVNSRRQAVSRARGLGLLENGAPAPLPRHNLPAQIFEDLGWQMWAVRRSIVLAQARLHAGKYRAARILAEKVVSLARDLDATVTEVLIELGRGMSRHFVANRRPSVGGWMVGM